VLYFVAVMDVFPFIEADVKVALRVYRAPPRVSVPENVPVYEPLVIRPLTVCDTAERRRALVNVTVVR
jgi:hypothetical protein